jgi:PAS domain S-box-containing protein
MNAAAKVNILLVDDRRQNLLALEEVLRSLDQNLIKATSGSEALKYLLKHDAAVILLDVEMPAMDGFQTAALIRDRDKSRHTPIIFLSAISKNDVHVNQGYSLGGVDYIFKPFSPEVLRSKVMTFVEMYKQRLEVHHQSALLRTERDLLNAVLDTVNSIVVVLDHDARILRVNRSWELMTGYTNDEVKGRLLLDFLEDRESAQAFLTDHRTETVFEQYSLTRSNTRRLVSWSCKTLSQDDGGTGRHLVVTGRDITELRQRTEELEGFTYSVSHDMRAPIRAIDGFTRILIEEYSQSLDDEGRRLLEIVRANTEKMGQLIDGLLALSRLGREKLIFSEIDMKEMARTAFEEQKATGGDRYIDFKVHSLPNAYGDKRLIAEVFQNLFSNAIKFTRTRKTAWIEVGHEVGATEHTYFVRDNGVGFNMEYAGKLFGTFQRLHAANEFEGSGIGLATVQRIIHRHGGRCWAEARLDEGAAFFFSLPPRDRK